MSHCSACPIAVGSPCPGENARRLCDLANPSHPDHRPAYRQSIPETARQLAVREYPPLAAQVAGLAGAFWSWATAGFAMADHGEQRRRMDICVLCPRWDSTQNRCRVCGCALQAKIAMRTEHCPEGRW